MSNRKDAIDKILHLERACPEGIAWAHQFDTLEQAWEACQEPLWMLWALKVFGYPTERKVRAFAATCTKRVQHLWPNSDGKRVVEACDYDDSRTANAALFTSFHKLAKDAAQKIVDRTDYSEAMAAAASAVVSLGRSNAFEAAKDAAIESRRAVAWDAASHTTCEQETSWQAHELRRIVGTDIAPLIVRVRTQTRGRLNLL